MTTFETSDAAVRHLLELQSNVIQKRQALDAAKADFESTLAHYKRSTKEVIGIEDGEPLNLLQIVTLIKKLQVW